MRGLARGLGLVALLGACEGGPPPYGFDQVREQIYELEFDSLTLVDEQPARVRSFAEFRLVAKPVDDGAATELALYLIRYYQSVQRGDERTEVTISDQGLLVRGGEHGELGLQPDQRTPTSPSLRKLLERPVASAIVSATGVVRGSAWHSYDPLLAGVDPLEWFLLATPILPAGGESTWSGSREVPPIGEYRLGIQLPVRYQRTQADDGTGERIRAQGFARRSDLTLADGFSGELELDFRGQAELGPRTELLAATSELDVRFDAGDGGQIHSKQRVEVRCTSCGGGINSGAPEPDQEPE